MLDDQPNPKPIHVMIGPEIFFAPTPLGLNMQHMIAFQREITPSAMFRFTYVAFETHANLGGKQKPFVERIKDFSIGFDAILFPVRAPYEETQTALRELAIQCDVVFPTEILKKCDVTIPNSRLFVGNRAGLVRALCVQAATTAAFDFSRFLEYAAVPALPAEDAAGKPRQPRVMRRV